MVENGPNRENWRQISKRRKNSQWNFITLEPPFQTQWLQNSFIVLLGLASLGLKHLQYE